MDIIFSLLIIFSGIAFTSLFSKQLDVRQISELKKLFFYHLFFSVIFYFYTRDGNGDAWYYWKISQSLTIEKFFAYLYEAKGTYFMYSFNYLFANVLGMSFFANTMLYSLLGYVGIVYFYVTSIKIIPFNLKFKSYTLFPLVFFMPNLHFWSSGIGKDTILFMCIGMFTYAILKISKRTPLLIVSLLLSYLVRPHITFFLIISFALAFLLDRKLSGFKRVTLSLLLIGAGLAILPMVMEYTKIEETSLNSFNQFSEKTATLLSRSYSGSSVDISSYPFPLKIFTFLYRPFFFDINGIPSIIASFENLALILLSIQVFKNKPIAAFKAAPSVIKGLVFFLIIGTLTFSQTLGNLGIMLRMRNMFLPGMLIFIIWSYSYQQQKKIERENHRIRKGKTISL